MPDFSISYSYNYLFLVVLIILFTIISLYTYKVTIPPTGKVMKYFLISLRILSLSLILFAIFEPILKILEKKLSTPIDIILIDNTKSITVKDSLSRRNLISDFLNNIETITNDRIFKYYKFGGNTQELSIDSLSNIDFSESVTNISDALEVITEQNKEISSITLISDGIINAGNNPVFSHGKSSFPIYTIGIGDTTSEKDISIGRIIHNDYIYADAISKIRVEIKNSGFAGNEVNVNLLEQKNLIEQKKIILNNNELQFIDFEFRPDSYGEKKLSINISELSNEFLYDNNSKSFYLKILDNKIKVLLLAAVPSSDLSFIKNALTIDTNLTVKSITQLTQNTFVENNFKLSEIQNSDVLFLIGFPSRLTDDNYSKLVFDAITKKNIPFLITISDGIDFNKLTRFKDALPFSFQNVRYDESFIQSVVISANAIIGNDNSDLWNNLAPVKRYNTGIIAKPESKILSYVKINGKPTTEPLIISRQISRSRSIAVLAKDIWRWKLSGQISNAELFNNFFANSIRWLNSDETDQLFTLKTSKKIFNAGEKVEFYSQYFDDTFRPVENAVVNVSLKLDGRKISTFILNSIGSGLYEGYIEDLKPGDYNFEGIVSAMNNDPKTVTGNFSVEEINAEYINTKMNVELLGGLSRETNGMFFFARDYGLLINEFENKKINNLEITNDIELNIWSNRWLLIFVIILFSLEWFFRKRVGML